MTKRFMAALAATVLFLTSAISARGFYEAYNLDGLLRIQKLDKYTELYDAQKELYAAQVDDMGYQLKSVDENEYAQERYRRDDWNSQIELIPMKLNEAKEKAKYELQTNYYNVFLLQKQNELLRFQLDYADAQLRVETVKLGIGDSTQAGVDALSVQKTSLEQAIEANKEIILLTKGFIAAAVGAPEEGFNPIIELPEPIKVPYLQQLSYLQERFLSKNAAVNEYRFAVTNKGKLVEYFKDMKEKTGYAEDAAKADLKTAQAQVKIVMPQYRQAVTGVVLRFLGAKAGYNPNGLKVLAAQLTLAEIAYTHGEISELEWLRRRAEIQEQIYKRCESAVTLVNAGAELKLLEQGVLIEG